MGRKYIDISLSIFFIVLAALLYGSADTVSQAVSQASTDSTSAYVNTLAIVLGIAGAAELVKSALSTSSIINFTHNPKKFIFLIVSLFSYVFILDYLGFVISTMIFLPITMNLMGYKSVIKSILIAAGITATVYLLFQVGFEILLPEATIF